MKRSCCLFWAVWFGINAHYPVAVANNLSTIIQQAYEYAPAIKSKQSALTGLRYGIDSAESNRRPQASLNAVSTIGEYNNSSTQSRGDGYLSTESNNVDLRIRQRLFDYQLTSSQIDLAKSQYNKSQAELAALKEEVAGNASLVYVDILRYRQLIALAEQNISDSDKMLAIIHKQVEKELTAPVDMYLARTRVSSAQTQLILQQESLRDAEIRYHALIGQSPPETLEIPIIPPLPGSLQQALDSVTKHPLVVSASEEISAARSIVRGKRSASSPQIDLELFATSGEDIAANLGRDESYGVNLLLRWDIYTGGRNTAELKRGQSELSAVTHSLDDIYRQLKESIQQSWNRVQAAESRLALLQAQAADDEKVYQSYRLLLTVGRRSPLDIMVVLSSQNQSRLAAKDAEYQVMIRKFQLLAAMGHLRHLVEDGAVENTSH